MIHLSGYFGTILYTGDFRFLVFYRIKYLAHGLFHDRYKPTLIHTPPGGADIFHPVIDVLYIDNTFCDPKFTFPPRKDAAEEVWRINSTISYI